MPNRISGPRLASFEGENRSSRESPTISLDSTASTACRSFRISSPASCWEFLSGAISFVGWTLERSDGSALLSMPWSRRVRIVQGAHRIEPGHRIHHIQHPHDHDDAQCLLAVSIYSGLDRPVRKDSRNTGRPSTATPSTGVVIIRFDRSVILRRLHNNRHSCDPIVALSSSYYSLPARDTRMVTPNLQVRPSTRKLKCTG